MSITTCKVPTSLGGAVGNSVHRRARALHVRAMASKTANSKVVIRTHPTPVEFGQSIAVVSNANAWETETATELSWTEGDVWQGELEVPSDVGNLEFKLVKVAGGAVIEWEEGDNKSCAVSKGSKMLECSWGMSELTEKKAPRKRSSSPKKKKEAVTADVENEEEDRVVTASAMPVAEPVAEPVTEPVAEPVAEPVVELTAVVESSPEPIPEPESVLEAPSVAGEEILYTFDAGDDGESAADIARRMYGGQ